MIEEAIRKRLDAASSVTTLIGSGVNMRCYPLMAPAGAAFPRLVRQLQQGEHVITYDGQTTLKRDTIQIVAQARTRYAAKQLADAVLKQLNAYRGVVTLSSGTLRIRGIFHQTDSDAEIVSAVGQEMAEVYEVLREYLVCYEF